MLTDAQLINQEIPTQEVNLTSIVIKWPNPAITYYLREWQQIVEPALKLQQVLSRSGLVVYLNLN